MPERERFWAEYLSRSRNLISTSLFLPQPHMQWLTQNIWDSLLTEENTILITHCQISPHDLGKHTPLTPRYCSPVPELRLVLDHTPLEITCSSFSHAKFWTPQIDPRRPITWPLGGNRKRVTPLCKMTLCDLHTSPEAWEHGPKGHPPPEATSQ